MANAPFYALLAYMLIDKLVDVHLTKQGLRTLSVRKPPGPKPKAPDPAPAEAARQEFPGDGYRPQVGARRAS